MARKLSAKAAAKALDRDIERAYYEVGMGVAIDIFDIPKIFAAGRKAAAEDDDVRAAVHAAVAALRKN